MTSAGRAGQGGAITVERIERAIDTVVDASIKHNIDLSPTLRRLEAERDKLLKATSGVDYAREILARRTLQRNLHDTAPTLKSA